MRPLVKRLLFALLLLALTLGTSACARAMERDGAKRTVTVGVYSFGDYMELKPDGRYSGYSFEYLYEIAKYSGWHFKFVNYDSFDACYEALRQGKIDILPAVFWSLERERNYLLSAVPMGSSRCTLIVRSNDRFHSYDDLGSFQNMRVGVTKGAIDAAKFREWAKANGLRVRTIDIDSTPDLLQALDSGAVDAVSIAYIGTNNNYRVVADFSPMGYYFIMPKDRVEVKKELDRAMNEISMTNSDFEKDLNDKYFSASRSQTPVFTKDEHDFIRCAGDIKIALGRNNAPFSSVGGDGSMQGILPDLYRRFGSMSGLAFSFVPVKDLSEALKLLETGSVSVIGQMNEDRFYADNKGLLLTSPFMKLTLAQITRKGNSSVHILALPDGIAQLYSGGEQPEGVGAPVVKRFNSDADCFAALKNGQADAMYCSTIAANYLINRDHAEDFIISTLSSYSLAQVGCTSSAKDRAIYSILNRCIRFTSASVLDELVLRNTIAEGNSFAALLKSVPLPYVAVIGFFLCFIIFMLVMAIVSLLRHSRAEQQVAAAREREKVQEAALAAAERSSESKTEFLSNISHDMRTPLNGILGFADMAVKNCRDPKLLDCLEKIRISGGLLLNLVNDTLEITRIDSGKFTFTPEPVTCREMLDSITVPIRSAAETKGVSFILRTHGVPTGSFMIDKLNMQKIFLNLLSNAVKFTPAGGTVEFEISAEECSDGSIICRSIVRDNGIGISDSFLPRMFEPFAQEHSSSICGTTGTGLGLAIVKRLVGVMGGSISVKSTKGTGSEFTVVMPVEKASAEPEKGTPQAPSRDLCGKKVLLCEDNAMNTEIARAMLESRGLLVTCTADGREGAETFAASGEDEFSVILMDIRMPVMDGRAASRAIRAMDRGDAKTIPIIAMTADAFAEDVAKCKEAGMDSHVPKPIDSRLLFSELERLIK